MNYLYYGGGDCTISGGTNIQGVEIRYRGAIEITKTCGDDCLLTAQKNGILIVSLSGGPLSNLFTYTGEIKITSVVVADNNAQKVTCKIKRVMDHSELLNTKSEDMTEIVSEDLKATYKHKSNKQRTKVLDNFIKNKHSKGNLYLEDGTAYSGAYHIHLDTGKAMTGADHSAKSEDLFIITTMRDGSLIKSRSQKAKPSR